ncbi:hypothetical protein SK128_004812 [Halocaridina rubra]|uniref:MADF domain-containing protein n=1 Tax=Halocaridina rubra TaxID=373956 RepID=A0AAN8WKY7_HALRR
MYFSIDELLPLVRDRPILYDTSDRRYRDREIVAGLWREIASILNATDTECKEKWHHLRSNFMRERRRMREKPPEQGFYKRWAYYDDLEFLVPYITPRKSSSNFHDIFEDKPSVEAEVLPEHLPSPIKVKAEVPTEGLSQNSTSPLEAANSASSCSVANDYPKQFAQPENIHSRPKKRLRKCGMATSAVNSGSADSRLIDELKKLREKTSAEENDPDRLFLLSLLSMMRELLPADKMDIRIEIHKVFQRKLYPQRPSKSE